MKIIKKIRLTLLASFCLLIVAPKTTCKSKEGERTSKEKKNHNLKITNYKPYKTKQKSKLELRITQNINQLIRFFKSKKNKSA